MAAQDKAIEHMAVAAEGSGPMRRTLVLAPGIAHLCTTIADFTVWPLLLGLISGLACIGVRYLFRLLQWIFIQHVGLLPEAAATLSRERAFLTPVLGALCATAILWVRDRWIRPEHFEEYIEAIRLGGGQIPFRATLWRTLSSAFSVASGAAIGREGSMVQFAAAVTSWAGERVPTPCLPLARRVACGAAAAVAAAYQAPFAGVFFALEIVLGEWSLRDIPQLALASVGGWLMSRTLLDAGPLFAVPVTVQLSSGDLWGLLLIAPLALLAPLYRLLLRSLRFAALWPLALLWSAILVGALGLLRPEVWGNGDGALLEIVHNTPTLSTIAIILVLRLAATLFCVGTGTVGGVFTPTLFTGAALGLIAGHLLHLPAPLLLALVGMGAFLAAVTHAPLMASFMVVELTRQWHLLPLLLLCNLLSWQIARSISRDSLYAIATPDR